MTNVFMQVLQFLLVRGFRFSHLMSSEKRPASSPALESEEGAYRCYFCDIFFLSLESLFRHKKYYCPKRRRLPTSCTVTTSMLPNASSSNAELAPPGNSSSQVSKWTFASSSNGELAPPGNSSSQVSKWTFAGSSQEAVSDFDVDISPHLAFESYLAACLMGGYYYAENLETASEGKLPARCAKRKRRSSEQESDTEVGPSSPKKRDNTASISYPGYRLFDAFLLENELKLNLFADTVQSK